MLMPAEAWLGMMLFYQAQARAQISGSEKVWLVGSGVGGSAGAMGGALAGSPLMKEKLSRSQLKKLIGVVLWLVAAKMFFDVFK
jgi:uncharacterized membrane protein YfcA